MALALKHDVRPEGLEPEMLLGVMIIYSVWESFGFSASHDCVITSITDGAHSPGSLHHTGQAVDIRTKTVKEEPLFPVFVHKLKKTLGRHYDVVLEPTHLHVEYDYKK